MTVRVRRFFYVRSPKGSVLHIQYGKSHSSGMVACGPSILRPQAE